MRQEQLSSELFLIKKVWFIILLLNRYFHSLTEFKRSKACMYLSFGRTFAPPWPPQTWDVVPLVNPSSWKQQFLNEYTAWRHCRRWRLIPGSCLKKNQKITWARFYTTIPLVNVFDIERAVSWPILLIYLLIHSYLMSKMWQDEQKYMR